MALHAAQIFLHQNVYLLIKQVRYTCWGQAKNAFKFVLIILEMHIDIHIYYYKIKVCIIVKIHFYTCI